jgi:hypothetical protein
MRSLTPCLPLRRDIIVSFNYFPFFWRFSIHTNMGLPTDVLKARETCDRTDTLVVLVCSVFCTSPHTLQPKHPKMLKRLLIQKRLGNHSRGRHSVLWLYYPIQFPRGYYASHLSSHHLLDTMVPYWYTLTYCEGGAIFGDLKYAFHSNVLTEPVGTIPAVLFSFFQLVFQATVCAIAVGRACE